MQRGFSLADALFANVAGKAVYDSPGNVTFCVFADNATGEDLVSGGHSPALYNCTFAGNAVADGKSVLGSQQTEPSNCIIDANGRSFMPCAVGGVGTSLLWNFTRRGKTPDWMFEADPHFADREAGGVRLGGLSPARFVGDLQLVGRRYMQYANYLMTADVQGNPVPFDADGKTHLGAVQTGFFTEVSLPREQDGIVVDGGSPGNNFIDPGTVRTLTISEADSFARKPLGVIVTEADGSVTTNLFADLPACTWSRTVTESSPSFAVGVYSQPDWYVDAERGNDENDGLSEATAKRTLAAAASNEAVRSGDVIHVLPGTYDDGAQKDSDGALVFSRVVVPAGVTIISTAGRDRTIIKGAKAPVSESGDGCGEGAVRCAYLGAGARLVGFTLTGGRALLAWRAERPQDFAGGGVCGEDVTAEAEDCLFTDCKAGVSAGYRATFRRCRADECGVSQKNTYVFSSSTLKNCLVNGSGGAFGLSACQVYNSTVCPSAGWHCVNGGDSSAYNSVLCGYVPAATRCFGCVLATNATYTTWSGSIHSSPDKAVDCVFTNVAVLALSPEDWAPLSISSPLVDAGRAEYTLADVTGVDLAGVPRVLNGAIDIGAYEWDWRTEYRLLLARGRRWLTLEHVSSDVVAAEGGLRLSAGAKLAVTLAAANGDMTYRIPYATTSTGSLAIWRAGIEEPTLLAGEGVYALPADQLHRLTFGFVGDGEAIVGLISRNGGFLLLVR